MFDPVMYQRGKRSFGRDVETQGHADDRSAILRRKTEFLPMVSQIPARHSHVARPSRSFDRQRVARFAIAEPVVGEVVVRLGTALFNFGCRGAGKIVGAGGCREEQNDYCE
jgi:hypothetical protein